MEIIGHRGARGLAPENTSASIKAALRCKVDMVEIDVRSTKDGVLVLCHNPSIDRYIIMYTNYADLRAADPKLTTLEQALRVMPATMPLNVEVKPGCDLILLLRTLHKHGRLNENLVLSSFSFRILKEFKRLVPEIQLAVNERVSGVRASYRANALGTKRLHFMEETLWSVFIRMMANQGWELYAFTVNDPKRAKKWKKAGLKGIFTDHPERF